MINHDQSKEELIARLQELEKERDSLKIQLHNSLPDRQLAEKELTEIKILNNAIVDSTADLIWSVDPNDFGLLSFNKSLEDYFLSGQGFQIKLGYRPEELFSTTEYVALWHEMYRKVLKEGPYIQEYHTINNQRVIELNFNILKHNDIIFGISVFGKEITDQKVAEEELRKKEDWYRTFVQNLSAGIVVHDSSSAIILSNTSANHMLGLTWEQLNGKKAVDPAWYFLKEDGSVMPVEEYPVNVVLSTGDIIENYLTGICRPDLEKPVWAICNGYPVSDGHGNIKQAIITFTDITKRKEAEELLRISEDKFRNVFEHAAVGISMTTIGGKLKTNNAFSQILGYSEEELSGIHWQEITYPADIETNQKIINSILTTDKSSARWEKRYIHKLGNIVWVDICTSLLRDEKGNPLYFITTITDITERKLAEIKLEKLTRLYAVISQVNQTIVHLKGKEKLLEEACSIAVDYGNFRMAWIGLIDEYESTLKPLTYAGFDDGYLNAIRQISISDIPEGRGPTGKALREGKHFVCSDFENDPCVNIWKDEALKRGYHSSIALPIKLFGKVIGAYTLYASFPNFFDQEEIELLSEVADDIGFALENIELEQKHQNTLASLVKSEEQFHSIFNNLQDAYFQTDKSGNFILVSPSAVPMYGFQTIEEMMCIQVEDIYANPSDRINLLKELTVKRSLEDFICQARRKDGTPFWVSMNVQIQTDENGQFSGTIGVVRDISERINNQNQIRILSSAVEQSPVSIVITDINGNIEYVNPKFSQITGYSLDEAIHQNPRILKSNTKSSDDYKQLWDTITNGREWHGEFLNIKKSGETYYESASISPIFDENGKIANYIAVKEDITARKKDEQQIKTLGSALEQSPSMIIITDKAGKIEYTNHQFVVFTQYPSQEVMGKNPRIFNPKHHSSESYNKMWESLKTGQVWKTEFRNRKKDGTPFWENVTIAPLTGSSGLTSNYIIIKEDITEEKHKEAELIKAKEKAEESDRLKSAFLANMSHEIRTPMNGILGFAGLLEQPGLTGDEQKEYISIIEKSGARMLNIINEIVDISRIESGLIEVSINDVNINEQIKEVYDLLYLDAVAKGIKFSFVNSLPEPKALINTDREKMYAILVNLVKNAIKYTDQGNVEFGYRVETLHAPSLLKFYVKDTGIGIPVNRQKAIFERFIQADILDIQARQGAGLGLSIAKAYVEMLGGQIWVESEYGIGSTFYFTLPLEPKPEEINGKKDNYLTVFEDNMTNHKGSEPKILIVEDDDASERYLTKVISKISTKILNASTGNSAVEICRNNPDIELVLMDIRMPGMNGYEATHQIRQFNKDVIIIAQTAFGLISDREKSLEAGCNDYISKPIKKDDLLALIHSYIA